MKLRRTSYARLQMQMRLEALQQSQSYSQDNCWSYSSSNKIANQRKLDYYKWPNASVSRQARLTTGKGRFGKRPPSFTIDRGSHSSNDNSNDSGFGWDSNSESQFSWGSTEDLRSTGTRSSTSSTSSLPFKDVACEKFLGLVVKPENNLCNIDTKPLLPVGSFSNHTVTSPWSYGKMCPASIITELNPLLTEERQCPPVQGLTVPISISPPRSLPISPVPVKRSRFNFQTPAIPAKSGTGLKLRNQNQNSGDHTTSRNNAGKKIPVGTTTLASSLVPVSRDGSVQLHILAQPEEQHRARYQTEGSRGAIKDRKGNGFPAVQLIGYDKPATLQIFIGTDQGKVNPHMFYQACKVSGKSSTPCNERKVEGTMLIEIEFEPSKEMLISCDCVGILKERNVDVEQRFPFHHAASSRKKSTKCRLIFRTTIVNAEGVEETLLAASLPILCTQPPGQPEICKKSLSECTASGREELFIIGKNFLKDTKVLFQEESAQGELLWEAKAEILKDYLQQNHLICVVPPYKDEQILIAVDCKVAICSGGKMSEPNRFTYLPNVSGALTGVSTSDGSCVSNSNMDTCPQSQAMNSAALQQQIAHGQSALSLNMPAGGSLVQAGVESIVENSVSPRESGNMVQVSDLEVALVARSSRDSNQNVSFGNALMNTTTMQQERHVVSELQSLLDQSSQQGLSDINDAKERDGVCSSHISIGTSSFLGQDLGDGLVLGNIPYQNNVSTAQPVSLQLTNYQDLNRHQQLSPNLHQYQNSESVPMTCLLGSGINDILNMNTASIAQSGDQLHSLPVVQNGLLSGVQLNHSLNETMTSVLTSPETECLTAQNMMLKIEPLSPVRIGVQPVQVHSNGVNMMNLIGGDMQQHEGGLANAITQMSDNELLSYINPSCFDQVMKCC